MESCQNALRHFPGHVGEPVVAAGVADAVARQKKAGIDPLKLRGSYAGALGIPQFMPSSYLAWAQDFDGDGRRDIWGSAADALASAAHYLQASGWSLHQPWGTEVRLPSGFDYALADASIRKPLGDWRALGIAGIPDGNDSAQASLLLPAGHRGPAFLVLDNFRSILKYNNSTSYALAIVLLVGVTTWVLWRVATRRPAGD